MNLNDLKRIEKLPHLSAFPSEQLITELSLYERVLITTDDVGFVPATYDGDIPYVCVSNDVKMLHEFCQSEKPIMLPCSNCHDDRPFKQFQGWNPRKSIISKSAESKHKYTPSESSVNSASSMDKESEKYNMFNPTPNKPHYKFGEERLADIDQSQFQDYPWDMYVCECGNQCKRGILDNIFELRKDFICTLDKKHKNFVNFIIIAAVTEEPDEMKSYYKRQLAAQARDSTTVIARTSEEQQAEDLYNKYFNSLFLIKVGQYPSLKDLQLFDTKKYRNVLRKNYKDYTLALALYADAIGAGSFVYLRRILEHFVEEVHLSCIKQCDEAVTAGSGNAFDEEKYKTLRFNEKISYLEQNYHKTIIPTELNDIRGNIYGVISKGVHESTEEECLQLFPSAKYIIDTFIEEKIQQKAKQERLAEVKKAFQGQ